MTESNDPAVGVDWCSGGWLAVAYEDHSYDEVTLHDTVEEVWDYHKDAKRILIDVPIGLVSKELREDSTGELSRDCDTLARLVVGPRYRSVFTPPSREAVEEITNAKSHSEISAVNEDVTGRGLSTQAIAIGEGIAEVDAFLRDRKENGVGERLLEAHPEVCFRAFAESEFTYSKKQAPGYGERLRALTTMIDEPEGVVRTITADLIEEEQGGDADESEIELDDVIDALVLAVTACAPDEQLQRLPPEPSRDAHGLPMQMVYRAEEELETTE